MASENRATPKPMHRSPMSAVLPITVAVMLLGTAAVPSASAQMLEDPAPPTVSPEAPTVVSDSVVKLVRKQLGKRYVFGGAKPEIGFDCSGLLQYVWRAFKVDLPRNSAAQAKIGTAVARDISKLRVGDLLTFGYRGKVSHIGIYTGNGKFVHASTGSRRVVESLLDRKPSRRTKPWIGARRLRVAATDTKAK